MGNSERFAIIQIFLVQTFSCTNLLLKALFWKLLCLYLHYFAMNIFVRAVFTWIISINLVWQNGLCVLEIRLFYLYIFFCAVQLIIVLWLKLTSSCYFSQPDASYPLKDKCSFQESLFHQVCSKTTNAEKGEKKG